MHNFITDLGTLYVCLNNTWSKVGLTRAFFDLKTEAFIT
jgi:hypothetical protein